MEFKVGDVCKVVKLDNDDVVNNVSVGDEAKVIMVLPDGFLLVEFLDNPFIEERFMLAEQLRKVDK